MKYVCGWNDGHQKLQVYGSLAECAAAWELIFGSDSQVRELEGEEGGLETLERMTQQYGEWPARSEKAMKKVADDVNEEGNYYGFVFRPAFEFEVR